MFEALVENGSIEENTYLRVAGVLKDDFESLAKAAEYPTTRGLWK